MSQRSQRHHPSSCILQPGFLSSSCFFPRLRKQTKRRWQSFGLDSNCGFMALLGTVAANSVSKTLLAGSCFVGIRRPPRRGASTTPRQIQMDKLDVAVPTKQSLSYYCHGLCTTEVLCMALWLFPTMSRNDDVDDALFTAPRLMRNVAKSKHPPQM